MDKSILGECRSLFHNDAVTGWSLLSKFTTLTGDDLDIRGYSPTRRFDQELMRSRLLFSTHDLWMMCTGLARLKWMQDHAASDLLSGGKWSSYASLDIEDWHIQFRSLLDYIAEMICELAQQRKQVPDSFTKLWGRATKVNPDLLEQKELEQKLGSEWLSLLKEARWYSQIVSVRNATVHYGAQTMVFCEPSDGILFQVWGNDGARLASEEPKLMFNKNVVHFDRYAAYLMANLLTWLEKFASIAYGTMGLSEGQRSQNCHFGFGVLVDWIDSLIALAD